ncbi:MAG: hypothetical protein QOH20_1649 [Mycobacterium sp.]|nr:hypothetical protein [Mycobacterium sp.]
MNSWVGPQRRSRCQQCGERHKVDINPADPRQSLGRRLSKADDHDRCKRPADEFCGVGKRVTSEDKRHARDDYENYQEFHEWVKRGCLATMREGDEHDAISKRKVERHVDPGGSTERQQRERGAKTSASHCGCRTPMGRTTGTAASPAGACDAFAPPRTASAATGDRPTTIAMPATSSDCDRTAQLTESTRGVVFAESNGPR